MAAEMWASRYCITCALVPGLSSPTLNTAICHKNVPVTLQKPYKERKITLSFQMKQISTNDRQQTGRMKPLEQKISYGALKGTKML